MGAERSDATTSDGPGDSTAEAVAEDTGGGASDTSTSDTSTSDTKGAEVAVIDTSVVDAGASDTTSKRDAPGLDVSSDAWPAGVTVDSPGCGRFPGPKMARIEVPRDGGVVAYCIDTTEVTNGDYLVFLDAPKPALPAWCGGKTDFGTGIVGTTTLQRPVGFVDWCDSWAYCKWAGKRLCGAIGGGRTNKDDYLLSSASQWSWACGNGAANTPYPYGATSNPNLCVSTATDPADVASALECHGTVAPYDQIYDLVGNAAEWEDACDAYEGRTPDTRVCKVRGGATQYSDLSCDRAAESGASNRDEKVSFRCCVDL